MQITDLDIRHLIYATFAETGQPPEVGDVAKT